MSRYATTLLEYLDKRLGRHTGNGPEYHFYCPACIDRTGSEANTRKFTLNLTKHKGQCWRCEFKVRDLPYLFRHINGGYVTVEENAMLRRDPPMVQTTIRAAVRDVIHPKKSNERLRYPRFPAGTKPITIENRNKMPWKRGYKYVLDRGFDFDDILRFDIHYCPKGPHANHLIFPCYQGGERVYWTTRYAGKDAPYLSLIHI